MHDNNLIPTAIIIFFYLFYFFVKRWSLPGECVARNTCQSFIIKYRLNSTILKFRSSTTAYSGIGRAERCHVVRGGSLELESNSGTLSRTDVNLTIFDAHRWVRDVTVLISLIFWIGWEWPGRTSRVSTQILDKNFLFSNFFFFFF